MFRTRVTEMLGIEHPIVGGCMMHISGPEFVAAVSNAGALGIMASAMFDTQEEFRQAVRRARALTDKPFGVNLSLFPALRPIDNALYVEVILEEGVDAIVERWVGKSVKDDPRVQQEIGEFFKRHGVKSVAATEVNIGCPHEEGEDFPVGEDCPFCPFWKGKQGSGSAD